MASQELLKHKHICLVEDHYNPLGIVRSLGEAGINPIVLLASKNPRLVHKSKYVKDIKLFNDVYEAYEYMVSKYSNEKYKPFVYNGSDRVTLLLDKHYNELKDHFYFSNGQGGIEKYLKKYDITLLASECGCHIPREELVKNGELPQKLNYPVITKAESSASLAHWKTDSFICNSPDELLSAYKSIRSKNVLIQEFIKKKNEYCIDGISINAGEQVYMPYAAQYYRFSKESYGAYMYFKPILDGELIEKIKNIIKGAKYTGIFCIEFLIGPDDQYYFLEVNFRNSGWSYAFTYGGFNLLEHWAEATIANNIDISGFNPRSSFTAMSEFEDYDMFVKTHEIGFFAWLKDFLNSDCCFVYNKNDPKPFINCIKEKIKGKIHRSINRHYEKKD